MMKPYFASVMLVPYQTESSDKSRICAYVMLQNQGLCCQIDSRSQPREGVKDAWCRQAPFLGSHTRPVVSSQYYE